MRKNKMMRTASGLLVATLLTTSVISGTFAKYTTSDSAEDSARVAKWGVKVTATGDNAFATEYNGPADGEQSETVTVKSNKANTEDKEKVVAPGTKGTLLTYKIEGTPEVMVNIDVKADLTLSGWEIGSETKTTYCPIVFTLKRGNETKTYKLGDTETTTGNNLVYKTIDALQSGLEDEIKKMKETNTTPNTDLADEISVSWEWPYGDDTEGAYQTDEKDTALGDLTSAPTIKMDSSVTVTQVD